MYSLVTLASIGDVRVAIVALGAVARKASILLSAVTVLTLAKAAHHVPWAVA
jgi:hypothetical protein